MARQSAIVLVIGLILVAGCQPSVNNDGPAKKSDSKTNDVAEKKDEPKQEGDKAAAAAKVETNPLRNPYFGDLHVHTSYSLDAYIFGTRNDPRSAYRFARGEEVTVAGDIKHRLRVPLDFAAVTDHAETFAEVRAATDPKSLAYNTEYAERFRANDAEAFVESMTTNKVKEQFFGGNPDRARAMAKSVWQDIQDIADEFYEPGKFTTFKAWEYSWSRPDQMMLHRNVIFRGDKVPPEALGYFDLKNPEDLWNYLNTYIDDECRVVVIPHNANWSWGYAFSVEKPAGGQYTDDELRLRAKLERLVEILQVKGASEAMPGIGATDEDSNFEQMFTEIGDLGDAGKMAYGSTVRNGLKRGLKLEEEKGFNPFKVGIIASTDNHNGVAGDTQEDTYNGHEGVMEKDVKDRRGNSHTMRAGGIRNNPGGLAAVWADANTREHIFDALERRETWGTSGTRIMVRFFGGFEFTKDQVASKDFVKIGYEKGVPMGGDLTLAPQGKAPTFMLWATKDPHSGNLDKIQIIKGWLSDDGEMQERVYDVVWSGDRQLDDNGKLPPLGNTVDTKTATYQNTIGAAELSGLWTDPEFKANERAFYYVRVLEIPTPRYSTYDAVRAGLPLVDKVPATIQERAWTSPIWYSPTP